MRLTKIPFTDTKAFSSFFTDYIHQKESLKPFFDQFPSIENFNKTLTNKGQSFSTENRKVLEAVIQKQYSSLIQSEPVRNNIASLTDSKTFTVTTGHQLNIFTGPLYFIYKIVTVINACRALKKKYPAYSFVPVYWMASEDHDYDEIKYFRLYGKKYVWETKQTGAVGRFKTEGFEKILNELPGDVTPFKEAYLKHKTLSDAVRYYFNELFGNEGVVVVDADDHDLKSLLKEVMKEDILKQATINHVDNTNKGLEDLGYKTQIFCRDINFFYLDNNIRSRIEKQGDRFQVLDTQLNFSEEEILTLINTQPEKFSPNVILRPLYQEIILPNLGYVGGPAEIVYWLQLKAVFDHFNTPFPVLIPRNFALVIDHTVNRKLEKTGLNLTDFFEEKNYIFNHWVLKNTRHNLTVGEEHNTISNIYNLLRKKAESIDPTLGPFVGAEGKRAINSLEKIERKLLRAEKRLHTDRLKQIESVKDALFPNGNLQERTDNFLNFYQQDNRFIAKLIEHFDPFDFSFNVLTYTE
ncbi:bacillithiol biosynthesis cysteine-adding enzyme BshC [Chryseosolibacter indicus]|uniref:Putative cysteine ligase BshC n=1 Tax=Chryseosolibacter indicus TaxID=2782351 RepID=A0ABS5VME5_9BACT|nr:bacillithiol biosynthesis cysteine-adding enzyme BshC [Chryseosolibacter indicus]MBT1702627.1 bacillithiol biosynthesis cysteine-adding enzyme BshC [Chryseosolibacter indicus]